MEETMVPLEWIVIFVCALLNVGHVTVTLGGILMRAIAALLLALSLLATPSSAQAQQYLGEYFAYLGRHDMFNSRGVRLTDLGSILQQDRANYHRFNLRDNWDDPDPVFHDRAVRARIPNIWQLAPTATSVPGRVARGEFVLVRVTIYGNRGGPTTLIVEPAG